MEAHIIIINVHTHICLGEIAKSIIIHRGFFLHWSVLEIRSGEIVKVSEVHALILEALVLVALEKLVPRILLEAIVAEGVLGRLEIVHVEVGEVVKIALVGKLVRILLILRETGEILHITEVRID